MLTTNFNDKLLYYYILFFNLHIKSRQSITVTRILFQPEFSLKPTRADPWND